jgi:hypothetical protein
MQGVIKNRIQSVNDDLLKMIALSPIHYYVGRFVSIDELARLDAVDWPTGLTDLLTRRRQIFTIDSHVVVIARTRFVLRQPHRCLKK